MKPVKLGHLLSTTLPLAAALLIRLYPYTYTGLPFSIDAWPLLKGAEALVNYSPVDFENSTLFDGYNNYWPAVMVFGAEGSLILNLNVKAFMGLFVPIAAALSVLTVYTITLSITRSRLHASIASTVLAFAPSHVIFTAGVTKETLANPIYLTMILMLLSPKAGTSAMGLWLILSLALVSTHHLTTFIALGIITSIAVLKTVLAVKTAQKPSPLLLAKPVILGLVTLLYYYGYALRGFKFDISMSEWISAFSYQLLFFTVILYQTLRSNALARPSSHSRTGLLTSIGLFTILLLSTHTPIVPGAPEIPLRYLLYFFPYIFSPLLVAIGLRELGESRYIIKGWLGVVLALEAYSLFSRSQLSLSLLYRGLNFLYPPLAPAIAAGLEALSGHRRYAVTSLITLGIAVSGLSIMYATVHLQEPYTGYQWLNTADEYQAGIWLRKFHEMGIIAGDMKASYMLAQYFGLKVDVAQGLAYLSGWFRNTPDILYTYKTMDVNGYLLSPYAVELPADWRNKVATMNLIYVNGFVEVSAI